ncbi:hypothetical protein LINGRAHAP2_LOCUS28746 [Linum grandiflorum]
MIKYLTSEWLPYNRKWAHCTSTNKVESQHSSLKSWLNTSTSHTTSCDCVIATTHGISCQCMLALLEKDGMDLMCYHVHGFWRSLEYYKPSGIDKWEDHDTAGRDVLKSMVQQICDKDGPIVSIDFLRFVIEAVQLLPNHELY